MSRFLFSLLILSGCAVAASAADAPAEKKEAPKPVAKPTATKPAAPAAPAVKPTLADVPYGEHPKQVLDFYKAESKEPTPLVFYIHGGGWRGGSKNGANVRPFLAEGISVVSVEYRFVQEAGDVTPPVKAPLHDAARALQFVRSKAAEWNIDKTRIGATGGSAGACSSLWLAFHDDLADPKSSDPIARESTRLLCAAVSGAQTTLDPQQIREWMPNGTYGGHAFGINAGDPTQKTSAFAKFLADREKLMPWIKEYSPYELVTADDPPIGLYYGEAPKMGQETRDPTHSANYGLPLQEKCKSLGVECELVYPQATDAKHGTYSAFLIAKLKPTK